MPEILTSTFRFSPEFHEEVRIAIARRRIRSMQQAMDAALRLWLDRGEPTASEPPPAELATATKEELAWCGKLVSLMQEGEPGTIDLVQHALNRHARQVRELRKQAGT